jgi:DNA-binding transcriptional ArsR family regulator
MINQHERLDRVFHALADPARRAILERLGRGPAPVTEIARPLPMSLPAAMQHLNVLEEAGLVRTAKVGRVRTCAIAPRALNRAEQWIHAQRAEWERRLDRLGALLESSEEESDDDGK